MIIDTVVGGSLIHDITTMMFRVAHMKLGWLLPYIRHVLLVVNFALQAGRLVTRSFRGTYRGPLSAGLVAIKALHRAMTIRADEEVTTADVARVMNRITTGIAVIGAVIMTIHMIAVQAEKSKLGANVAALSVDVEVCGGRLLKGAFRL